MVSARAGLGRTAPVALISAAVVVALAGCSGSGKPEATPSAQPSSSGAAPSQDGSSSPASSSAASSAPASPSQKPASAAGGLCKALSYDQVHKATGVRLQVSAASGKLKGTATCVLRGIDTSVPNLILTSATVKDVDSDAFSSAVEPKGADSVDNLGEAAYSTTTKHTATKGPSVQVGWLSGSTKVYTLSLTAAPETSDDRLPRLKKGLIKLANSIDAGRNDGGGANDNSGSGNSSN